MARAPATDDAPAPGTARSATSKDNGHANRHHTGYARRHAPGAGSVTSEEKAALIKGASQLLLEVLKPLESTFIIIDEVDMDNWG